MPSIQNIENHHQHTNTMTSMVVISLSGESSSLSTNFYPEIELDDQYEYSCCLLDLSIQTTILKVVLDDSNNVLTFRHGENYGFIELPTGKHEIQYIIKQIEERLLKYDVRATFRFDEHTMKYFITTSLKLQIDFVAPRSIGPIFGFDWQKLYGGTTTRADHSIGNLDIQMIRVNCDLVNASYHNGISTHAIHEFHPKDYSNYKMIEQPNNLIYLPVDKQRISAINITVTDQDGDPIDDLRDKQIHCRINIKRN